MMADQGRRLPTRVMQLYYAATVVFLLLDFSFGINLCVASPDAWPGWRALYYLLCFVCLGLTLWRSSLSLWLGTAESLLTVCMLIISTGAVVLAPAESILGLAEAFFRWRRLLISLSPLQLHCSPPIAGCGPARERSGPNWLNRSNQA